MLNNLILSSKYIQNHYPLTPKYVTKGYEAEWQSGNDTIGLEILNMAVQQVRLSMEVPPKIRKLWGSILR